MLSAADRHVYFFDFDRTLTKTDTIKFLLIALLLTRPARIPESILFVLRNGIRTTFRSHLKHLLIGLLVKNRSVKGIDRALGIYSLMVRCARRSSVMSLARRYAENGDLVVVGTASPEFAVRHALAGASLQVEGTRYETAGGRFTGRLATPVCIGDEKLLRIAGYLATQGISWIDKAYSDHHADLPIMRFAKKAVFVHPDRITARNIERSNDEVLY